MLAVCTVFNSNQSVRCTVFISEGQLQPSIASRVTSFIWATPATSSEYVIPSDRICYSLRQNMLFPQTEYVISSDRICYSLRQNM